MPTQEEIEQNIAMGLTPEGTAPGTLQDVSKVPPPPAETPPEPPVGPPEPPPTVLKDPDIPKVGDPGVTVEERLANGQPSVLSKDGEKYYLPGSTAYESGNRTESQYLRTQQFSSALGPYNATNVQGPSVVILDGDGNPVARWNQAMIDKSHSDPSYGASIDEYLAKGQYRVPVKDSEGREVLLTPKQADRLNNAQTNSDKLAVAKDLNLVPQDTTLKDFSMSPLNIQKAQAASDFVDQQTSKRQSDALSKLAKYKDGDNYSLGKALADGVSVSVLQQALFKPDDIKAAQSEANYIKATPQGKFDILQSSGSIPKNATFDKINPDGSISYNIPGKVENIDFTNIDAQIKSKGPSNVIKTIWQALTPWNEQAGQTFIDYVKSYPSLVIHPTQKSQDELKAQYEQNQKFNQSAPLWAKILFPPDLVVKDSKGAYHPVLTGVAPGGGTSEDEAAGLASKIGGTIQRALPAVERVAQQVGTTRPVRTISPEDVGMTEAKFAEYLKAREAIPNLTPQAFEDAQKVNTKIDWNKIQQALKEGSKIYEPSQEGPDLSTRPPAEIEKFMEDHYPEIVANIKNAVSTPATVTEETVSRGGTVAAYQRWLAANPFGTKTPTKVGQINVTVVKPTDNDVKTATATVLSVAVQKAAGTQSDTKTDTQNKIDFQQALNTSIQNEIKNITDTKLRNKVENQIEQLTQQQTETKTQTKPKTTTQVSVKIQPQTATKTETKTQTQMQTKTQTQSKQGSQTGEGTGQGTGFGTGFGFGDLPPEEDKGKQGKLKLPSPKNDKEKRSQIKKSGGAVAWREGELGPGRDVWATAVYPYDSDRPIYVVGKPPVGATIVQRGKGSAFATAQITRGRGPTHPVTLKSGFENVTISSHDKRVSLDFTPIKSLTAPSITLRSAIITEKRPRISGARFRISGKRPRIR